MVNMAIDCAKLSLAVSTMPEGAMCTIRSDFPSDVPLCERTASGVPACQRSVCAIWSVANWVVRKHRRYQHPSAISPHDEQRAIAKSS